MFFFAFPNWWALVLHTVKTPYSSVQLKLLKNMREIGFIEVSYTNQPQTADCWVPFTLIGT